MKNILYFAISTLLLLGCMATKNRKQVTDNTYRSFIEFKGDTVQYLTYNFINNKKKYIGKTFDTLLANLEMRVKSCTNGSTPNDKRISPNLSICFYDFDESLYRGANNLRYFDLTVDWQTPPQMDDVDKLTRKYKGNWNKAYQEFFKNLIIKDISIYIYPKNK